MGIHRTFNCRCLILSIFTQLNISLFFVHLWLIECPTLKNLIGVSTIIDCCWLKSHFYNILHFNYQIQFYYQMDK
jgi:hypothetical protein